MFSSETREAEAQYYLYKNDYHSGPFDKTKLNEMLVKNIISETDLICQTGTEDWLQVGSLFIPPKIDEPPVIQKYAEAPTTTIQVPSKVGLIQCRACGGEMVKGKAGGRSLFGHSIGLITKLAILGIGLLFLFIPIIGWVIGAALIIYALITSTGAKNRKVWKCLNCGTFFERA